jgi:hypothetical protein
MKKLLILLVSTIAFSAISFAQSFLTSGAGWNVYNDVGTLVGISKVVSTTATTCSTGTPMWHGPKNATTGLIGTNFANTTLRFKKTVTIVGCENLSFCLKTNLADVKVYIDNQLVNTSNIFNISAGTKTIEVKSTMPNLNWSSTVQPYISFVSTGSACFGDVLIDLKVMKVVKTFDLAPNPSDLQLTANNLFDETVSINIYSLTGQVIYNNTIEANNKLEINTSSFENGLYIVKLKGASGSETTRKITVSH